MAVSENSIEFCESNESEMKLYECNLCDAWFTIEKSLKLHLHKHKRLSCNVCGKFCASKSGLAAHRQSHKINEIEESSNVHFQNSVDSCITKVCNTNQYNNKFLKTESEIERLIIKNGKGSDSNYSPQVLDSVNFNNYIAISKQCNADYTQENNLTIPSSNDTDRIYKKCSETNLFHIDHSGNLEKSFTCNSCNAIFDDEISFKAHSKKNTVECVTCNRNFDSKCSLKMHICTVKVYVCGVCNESFTTEKSLKLHSRKHKNLFCDICKKYCSSEKDLIAHKQSHEFSEMHQERNDIQVKNSKKVYVFEIRNAKYTNDIPAKTATENNLVICMKCNKSFDSEFSLQINNCAHSKDFMCEVCKANYVKENDFTAHSCCNITDEICLENKINTLNIVKSGNSDKLFLCNICNTNDDMVSLEAHTEKKTCLSYHEILEFQCNQQVHNCTRPDKNYVCNICNSSYTTEDALKNHYCYHNDYACNFCEKKFSSKNDLAFHCLHLHKIESDNKLVKPLQDDHFQNSDQLFICFTCISKYNDVISFKSHTEKSTVKCEICNEICNSLCSLQLHKHNHSLKGYICNVCHKSFKLKISLKHHLYSHKTSTCAIFSTKDELATNIKHNISFSTHKEAIEAPCDIYKENFNSECQLQAHNYIFVDAEEFSCVKCKGTFTEKFQLEEHQTACIAETISCKICDSLFKDQNDLWEHYKSHTDKNLSATGILNGKYVNKTLSKSNQLQHSNDDSFACQLCQKAFTTKSLFAHHDCIHKGPDLYKLKGAIVIQSQNQAPEKSHIIKNVVVQEFACKICERKFSTKENLILHYGTHVTEMNSVKYSKAKNQLTAKLRNAKNIAAQKIVRNICKRKFSAKENLSLHSKTYTIKKNLKDCNRTKSVAVQKFICDVCEKRFSTRENLNFHCRIHANEKKSEKFYNSKNAAVQNLVCHVCKKKFSTKKKLVLHFSTHATKKSQKSIENVTHQNFVCNFCEKKFSTKENLNLHYRIHEINRNVEKSYNAESVTAQNFEKIFSRDNMNEKKIKCDICEESFSSKDNIKAHYEKHILIKKYICKICKKHFNRKKEFKTHYSHHFIRRELIENKN